MSSTDFLVEYQDSALNNIVGNPTIIGSTGPGGCSTLVNTDGWNATYKRMLREIDMTASSNCQNFDGVVPWRTAEGMMPAQPPSGLIYRVREEVAAEHVSGGGVSRVFWGQVMTWSHLFPGAPPFSTTDPGMIGFLWYQTGATAANWRCKASANDGTPLFDFDTGLPGDGPLYNFRIDFDGRLGEQNIKYYVDEVLIATFNPPDDVFGGLNTSDRRLGIGINCQGGNRARAFHAMVARHGWQHYIQTGPEVL
jgi:hypothetical protein